MSMWLAAYFGGSLAYMSPEQIEACNPAHERQPKDLDGRSDLFALAVVLWELLFGERPFNDDDMEAGWTAMLTAMAKRRRAEQPKAVAGAKEADLAWTPDGLLLMAEKDILYSYKRDETSWKRVADLAALGMHGVTRIAVSPMGDRIAFVTDGRTP